MLFSGVGDLVYCTNIDQKEERCEIEVLPGVSHKNSKSYP